MLAWPDVVASKGAARSTGSTLLRFSGKRRLAESHSTPPNTSRHAHEGAGMRWTSKRTADPSEVTDSGGCASSKVAFALSHDLHVKASQHISVADESSALCEGSVSSTHGLSAAGCVGFAEIFAGSRPMNFVMGQARDRRKREERKRGAVRR